MNHRVKALLITTFIGLVILIVVSTVIYTWIVYTTVLFGITLAVCALTIISSGIVGLWDLYKYFVNKFKPN